MNTTTIAQLANLDGIANDLDVQLILRTIVVMEFFMDIGEARWRNTTTTLTLTASPAGRQQDLPDDFWSVKSIVIPPAGATRLDASVNGLKYIGEDMNAVLNAEFNTVPDRPTGYSIAPRTTGSSYRAIRYNCIPDAAYTAYLVYERGPVFADYQSEVDMDPFVPEILQPGLVFRLRKEILKDRVGQGDPRFAVARDEYDNWLGKVLARGTDQAKRNFAVFAS